MKEFNQIILIGRIASDPKYTHINNVDKCGFSVATHESWKKPDGTWNKVTDFHWIEIKGERVKYLPPTFGKGDYVQIIGSSQAREYTKNDGTKDIWRSVHCDKFVLLLSKDQINVLYPPTNDNRDYHSGENPDSYAPRQPQQQYAQPQQQYAPPQQQYAPPQQYAQPQQQYAQPRPTPPIPQQPTAPMRPQVNQYGQPVIHQGGDYDFNPE